MTVYLVMLAGQFYDGGDQILAAFSTKDLAQVDVKVRKLKDNSNHYSIESWTVDE